MRSLRSLISMPECVLGAVTLHNRALRIIRECPNHLHHHSPCRCGRVDGFGQTAESSPGFSKPLHKSEHVSEGARQPVQFPDHEYVTLTQLIEKPMEFGPVPASAGGLLAINTLATSGLERSYLGGGVLIVGGDSGVADLHCTNVSPIEPLMQYLFATQESP